MEDGSFYVVRCWWKPIVVGFSFLLAIGTLASLVVALCVFSGCQQAPRQTTPNPSLVMHVTGTLNDPKVDWEYSRNDKYMGIRTDAELRSMRERYNRHLSLTIDTIDRQTSVDGRVRDRHTTTTRSTRTTESKR